MKCLPVRHPHDHALHAALTGHIDDGLEGRDERFAALKTKSFLWRPLLLEKLLKPVNRWLCCCFTLWIRTPPPPDSEKRCTLHLLCMLFQVITEVCWGMWGNTDRPCGSDHSAQESPLLLQTAVRDSWCLKLLSDPLALLHVVDEHKLYANVLTVGRLEERGQDVSRFERPNRRFKESNPRYRSSC